MNDQGDEASANAEGERVHGQFVRHPNKGFKEGNAEECGFCHEQGTLQNKLVCCEDCPSSYHSECLGYQSAKQCPRGKWKCYYCKVVKHGAAFVQKLAPNEQAVCAALMQPTARW